jgi:hypothetical protein
MIMLMSKIWKSSVLTPDAEGRRIWDYNSNAKGFTNEGEIWLAKVRLGRLAGRGKVKGDTLGFPHTPAVTLRGLLIISRSLHIPYQTFFFAQLLEPPHHLLDRFARSRLDFQHTKNTLSANLALKVN